MNLIVTSFYLTNYLNLSSLFLKHAMNDKFMSHYQDINWLKGYLNRCKSCRRGIHIPIHYHVIIPRFKSKIIWISIFKCFVIFLFIKKKLTIVCQQHSKQWSTSTRNDKKAINVCTNYPFYAHINKTETTLCPNPILIRPFNQNFQMSLLCSIQKVYHTSEHSMVIKVFHYCWPPPMRNFLFRCIICVCLGTPPLQILLFFLMNCFTCFLILLCIKVVKI